jgi:hypothetical protein
MRRELRRWRLHRRSDKTLTDLAHMFNPVLQGQINKLLRALLSVRVASELPPPQRHAREVGHAEIQRVRLFWRDLRVPGFAGDSAMQSGIRTGFPQRMAVLEGLERQQRALRCPKLRERHRSL